MNKHGENAPNILLITADQLRWDYVGAYGSIVKTPAIDRLADEGCLYERAYSPNPVCIPARHNLITGLPARYHGFDDNYFGPAAKACPWNIPTFAQILSDCGYQTAAIGKMHFQPERRATGFDLFLNCDEVVCDIAEDEYAQFLIKEGYGDVGSIHGVRNALYMQPQQSLLPEHLHSSHWIADRSIDYLRGRKNRTKPFLLWTGFIQPHPPFDVPGEWAHLYDGKLPRRVSSVTPLNQLAMENQCIADLPTEESIQRMRELYACAISYMDHQLNRILQTLDEEGLRERTLVIFVSDHGEMLGDLDTYQKFLPYDASCRIPMVMRWPGHIPAGERKSCFADLNDLLPTFLDVAGIDYPASFTLPGESLLKSNGNKDRTVQYVEHQRESKRWCCLIGPRYKYVHYYGDRDQFFDLECDPQETKDLLYGNLTVEEENELLRLKEELLVYEGKWGLPNCVKDGMFVPREPYVIRHYREECYPSVMAREPGMPLLAPIEEEILKAIKNEPAVKLDRLEIRDMLIGPGGMTEERFENLLKRAAEQGN